MRPPVLVATLLLGASLILGCHPRSATVRVSGAWALYPMMVRWAECYQQGHPGVRVDVAAGGAGKGLADCRAGLVDLGMVSRDLRPEELQAGLVPLPVAKDAVFAILNAGHPDAAGYLRRGLTRQALADAFLRGAAPGVNLYTRSDACGAAETWAQYLGGTQEDLKGTGIYGDPGLAEAVRRDPRGMGYVNLGFAFDTHTGRPPAGLVVLPLDSNGNGLADPAEQLASRDQALAAIRSGAYPAPPARNLYLVTKGPLRPELRAFLAWILAEGQALTGEAGFLPVDEGQRTGALARIRP